MTVQSVVAPMPGLVTAHTVAPGERVAHGHPVVVVETMKCEWPVPSPGEGTVTWLAPVGTVVAEGEAVARLEVVAALRAPSPEDILALYGVSDAHDDARSGAHFEELDLEVDRRRPDLLAPVGDRSPSERRAGLVVGRISHRLAPHAESVRRVWLCGDAGRSLGAVAEPECRRIIAAIDLAERERVPLEWVAVSSGARISMSSGTENMDWCAAVVRRLVEFTQDGGQVVVVVAGVNVGAQSYWNAEATMLMHCAGLLVMVEGSSMVLTGHRALATAGGVSEPSDQDLGGTTVMGANGQAHHRVGDLRSALDLVLEHHALCASGPQHPRVRALTADTPERDVCRDPLELTSGTTVGDALHPEANPGRTLAHPIEPVMRAVVDRDAPVLSRWDDMDGAGGAKVWDTRIDGWAVTLVGIESRPRAVDGGWEAAATLYPMAARKVARALTHASGRRPAVVLANLAGFDGSRASLLAGQLEHGAELARAVVNFRGPIVVVVTGRFHGGAYVVLNQRLNPELRIVALEGTRVSVIGGSAAAEVVLRRDVEQVLAARPADGEGRSDHAGDRRAAVAEVARRFDDVHDVERAARTGSVERVVDPSRLRAVLASMLAEGAVDLRLPDPTPPLAGRTAAPA